MLTREEVLRRARIVGEHAPIDCVPDPTADGFPEWKKSIETYFGCAMDNFLAEYRSEPFTDEILVAMKEGFKKLCLSQPYVEVPLQPMEELPRILEDRLIDEAFSELKLIPHHCTH